MLYRIGTHKDFSDIEDCIASTEYYAPVDASIMDGTFVVAVNEHKQVMGCVWVMHFGRNAYVDYLAIRPGLQHKGVAVRLLTKLQHILRRRGVRYVRSCVHLSNLEAIRISKAFGSVVHSPYALCFVDLDAEKSG